MVPRNPVTLHSRQHRPRSNGRVASRSPPPSKTSFPGLPAPTQAKLSRGISGKRVSRGHPNLRPPPTEFGRGSLLSILMSPESQLIHHDLVLPSLRFHR